MNTEIKYPAAFVFGIAASLTTAAGAYLALATERVGLGLVLIFAATAVMIVALVVARAMDKRIQGDDSVD